MLLTQVLLRRRRSGVSAGPADGYIVNGQTPVFVADYENAAYVLNGEISDVASMVTFARTGEAFAPGSDGYLDTFATGVIRTPSYMLDSGSWVRGLTLETSARTNAIGYSNITDWTKLTSVVTGGETGVDGAASAYKLQDDSGGGSGNCRVERVKSGLSTSTKYTWSWYLKADQLQWVMAYVASFTTPATTTNYFDAGTGTAGSSSTSLVRGVEDVGHGWYRCWVTFTTDVSDNSGTLSFWLSDGDGDFAVDRDGTSSILIDRVQLEAGSMPSSHITATGGINFTRNAESLYIAAGDWGYSGTAMSGALVGAETYADEGSSGQVFLFDSRVDTNNRITLALNTVSGNTGKLTLTVVNGGASVSVTTTTEMTPGVLSKFGAAWRITTSEINIAMDGTAAVAVANTAGIPDLSARQINFGGMGFRKQSIFWNADIGDTGIEEISAPGHYTIEVV